MNFSTVLAICIMLQCFGFAVFLWYFFKSVELQLKEIKDGLDRFATLLWKLERNLR